MTGDLIERKTVADILTAAADLIDKPGAWGQSSLATDKNGWNVNVYQSDAVCFCVVGAIRRVIGTSARPENTIPVRKALAATIGLPNHSKPLVEWNDAPDRTQAEVVAALRAAAEKARTAASSSSPGTEGGA